MPLEQMGIFLAIILALLFLWLRRTRIVQWPTKYRKTFLVLAGISGGVLAYGMYKFFPYTSNTDNPFLHSSLTILFLGLPTFFILWLFRTHDVKKQIDKTEENTNDSTFFECARMLIEATQQRGEQLEKKSLLTKIALEQLAYLKRETGFNKERIDLLTQGLNLRDLDLRYTDLRGLNLSRSNVTDTRFNNASYNADTKFDGTVLDSRNARDGAGMRDISETPIPQ